MRNAPGELIRGKRNIGGRRTHSGPNFIRGKEEDRIPPTGPNAPGSTLLRRHGPRRFVHEMCVSELFRCSADGNKCLPRPPVFRGWVAVGRFRVRPSSADGLWLGRFRVLPVFRGRVVVGRSAFSGLPRMGCGWSFPSSPFFRGWVAVGRSAFSVLPRMVLSPPFHVFRGC